MSINDKYDETKEQPIKEPKTYFDTLVNINTRNLDEYYEMVKKHTDNSFIISIIMTCGGFVLIVAGVSLMYFEVVSKDVSFIATIAGILTEFISAGAFYLYNKTVGQLGVYFESLVDFQKVLLTFKAVEDAGDVPINDKVIMINKAMEYIWGDRPLLQGNKVEK